MPPHPPVTTASISVPGPQTTHVQVTSITYVTTGIPAIKTARPISLSHEPNMESHSGIAQSTSRVAAPQATGVVFHLYQSPESTVPSSDSGNTNNGAIIGGILGGLAFLVLCLVIIALHRNKSRYQMRSSSKQGPSRPGNHMATNDAINEAHRRRKERNRRDQECRAHDSPYGLTPADMVEMFHQGSVMVAEQHTRRSFEVVENYLSRPVAVAVPGAHRSRPFRPDRPDSATLPASEEFDDVDLSDYYLSDILSLRHSKASPASGQVKHDVL